MPRSKEPMFMFLHVLLAGNFHGQIISRIFADRSQSAKILAAKILILGLRRGSEHTNEKWAGSGYGLPQKF